MNDRPLTINSISESPALIRQGGFTLVEVMVALLIVAVAISSLLFQMMSVIDNTAYLRDKAVAHWVALNQQELLYLENQHTNQLIDRERSGRQDMAGREWFWRVTPLNIATGDKNFQQVRISVSSDEAGDSSVVSLNILLDRYHASLDN